MRYYLRQNNYLLLLIFLPVPALRYHCIGPVNSEGRVEDEPGDKVSAVHVDSGVRIRFLGRDFRIVPIKHNSTCPEIR